MDCQITYSWETCIDKVAIGRLIAEYLTISMLTHKVGEMLLIYLKLAWEEGSTVKWCVQELTGLKGQQHLSSTP